MVLIETQGNLIVASLLIVLFVSRILFQWFQIVNLDRITDEVTETTPIKDDPDVVENVPEDKLEHTRHIQSDDSVPSDIFEFYSFQRIYFLVTTIAYIIDFLGAPYIYAMYSSYHSIDDTDVRVLLQYSFLTTAMSHCFICPMIDITGRRLGAILCMIFYCIRYSLIIWTTRRYSFILSQVMYGLGMSLLYTVYESWMIEEHIRRGFDKQLLQSTYSQLNIYISLSAIISSQCGAYIRQWINLTCVFFLAVILCLINIILICYLWNENKSAVVVAEDNQSVQFGSVFITNCILLFLRSFYQIITCFQIFSVGLSQCLYDISIWIFVILWTPLLSDVQPDIAFTGFMMSAVLGSFISSMITESLDISLPDISTMILRFPPKKTQEIIQFPLESELADQWYPAVETVVSSHRASRPIIQHQTSIFSLRFFQFNLYYVKTCLFQFILCRRKVPLRIMVMFYQLISSMIFLMLTGSQTTTTMYYKCLGLQCCYGIYQSAGLNFRSQIIPVQGRVVTIALFSVPSSIANSIIMWGTAHWTIQEALMIPAKLCFGAFFITFIALLFRIVCPESASTKYPNFKGVSVETNYRLVDTPPVCQSTSIRTVVSCQNDTPEITPIIS